MTHSEALKARLATPKTELPELLIYDKQKLDQRLVCVSSIMFVSKYSLHSLAAADDEALADHGRAEPRVAGGL